MAKELDIEQDVQDVENGIVALAKEIADLKAGGVQNVTQEQLDALDVRLKNIVAAITAAQ